MFPAFPQQPILSPQTDPLPEGSFLLPVCIDARTLNNLLTSAWQGRYFAEKEIDPVTGEEFHTIAWMMPLLEAMAFVNQPYLVACFTGDAYGMIRYQDCGLEQFNLITQEWEPVIRLLPLTAGPSCELEDSLYINAPPANASIVYRQMSAAALKNLWRVETLDLDSSNFRSWLFNAPNASGPDNVVFSPYSYNLTSSNTKENAAEPSWLHHLETNFLSGGTRFSELYWEYRGSTLNYRPLGFYINRANDYGQFVLQGGDISFLDHASGVQYLKAQNGNVQLFNNTTISIQTNSINAISQKSAFSAATISLLMLDSLDRTVIGRVGNGVVLRGNPVLIAPVGDANPIIRAEFTGGQRLLGFNGNAPIPRPIINGASLASSHLQTITALHALGLLNVTATPADIAPILALRIAGCGIEQTFDGDNWTPVLDDLNNTTYFLPLRVEDDCNGISLQDVPLDIQRVGGSTEQANPMINFSAVGEAALATLPMSLTFSAQSSVQLRPVANIEVSMVDPIDNVYKSQVNLNLTDATQTRTVISARANNTHAALGVLGALPVSRQVIAYGDLTDRELSLAIGQALHNFGFLQFIPCQPEFGAWAIEWRDAQIMQWPQINCGTYDFNGLTTSVGACYGLDKGFDANLQWTQNNDSNLVYAEIDITWSGIGEVTGFNLTLAQDPGVGGSNLLSEFRFTESGSETLEWSGDEDFANIGVGAVIQAGGNGRVTITRIKLEGYGEIPPAEGGLICG